MKVYQRNYAILIICLITQLLTACSKELEINGGVPDLAVSLADKTYKAGEPVEFQFTGSAGLISFYSGETFHEYAFREGRTVEAGKLLLSFNSNVQYGNQANQFSVQVSSDFNGNYSSFEHIRAATWTDVTSRFTIGTNATYVASGVKDITDLAVDGKPLYVAFRYIYRPSAQYGTRRTWRVQNFRLISSTTSLGDQTIGDMGSSGFTLVDENPDTEPAVSTITATTLTLAGTAITPSLLTSENWIVTKAFPTGAIDMGPDRPIPVKGIADAPISTFNYVYEKPGTYEVHFVAANANIDGSKQTLQTLNITIVP
ncbi:DUF5017 domain-containing protein [Chitinophaga cymbidii]|uniref:DUF5017 domain-containing protein n=1 Tax=Chitinophaga cymbidii TaxID=1096750 RepID=A0A512RFV4_9BACT|nr:DUF5017 domain-containing protein [Chitinophaga cymbidii]GEP94593.1 hypothetical protein CCY01nite_08530 [Chitinophaga cymbidii]